MRDSLRIQANMTQSYAGEFCDARLLRWWVFDPLELSANFRLGYAQRLRNREGVTSLRPHSSGARNLFVGHSQGPWLAFCVNSKSIIHERCVKPFTVSVNRGMMLVVVQKVPAERVVVCMKSPTVFIRKTFMRPSGLPHNVAEAFEVRLARKCRVHWLLVGQAISPG